MACYINNCTLRKGALNSVFSYQLLPNKSELSFKMVDFNTACEKAKVFTKKPSDAIFLEFYGLFKQATVGDCNIAKPGGVDLKGRAKWDAWNSRKGMSQDAAKAAYVQCYEKYAPTYA